MGAQSTKTFTVTAKVSTGSPEDTDVSWSLSPSHPDCYMFEYGDMGYVGGTTFSDDFVLSRADLSGNVCAGAWTLEAHAFDFGASPGSDDYEASCTSSAGPASATTTRALSRCPRAARSRSRPT